MRGYYGVQEPVGSKDSRRIEELENRIVELEKLVGKLVKSNKPSFQDFKFIKEDEYKKDREERDKRLQMTRMRAMFSR